MAAVPPGWNQLDPLVFPEPILQLREEGQGIIVEDLAADLQRMFFDEVAAVHSLGQDLGQTSPVQLGCP